MRRRPPSGTPLTQVAREVAALKRRFEYPDLAPTIHAAPASLPGGTVPTVFVVGPDAPVSSVNSAHFACNGSNDADVINAAIRSLPAFGGRVLLEGSFVPNDTLLVAAGFGHVVLAATSAILDYGSYGGNYINTNSPLTVTGITFTNADNGTQQPAIVSAVNAQGSLIVVQNIFQNMTILAGVSANLATGTANMVVANNVWDNIHIYKPFTNGALFYAKDGDGRGVFVGNTVNNVTAAGSGGTGHILWSNNIATGNVFAIGNYLQNVGTGMSGVAGGTAVASHNVVDGVMTTGEHVAIPSNISNFSRQGTLAVGTGTFKLPFTVNATLVSVQIAVGTSPTGADLIVDVNKNGSSIFSSGARPRVLAADADGVGAETVPDVTTSVTEGQYLTVDIDQIGSTVPGSDLVVSVEWRPTP